MALAECTSVTDRQTDGRTDHDMATSTATGGTADASSNAG